MSEKVWTDGFDCSARDVGRQGGRSRLAMRGRSERGAEVKERRVVNSQCG
jgi:hypothetical protein